jgi:toxin ParE1/3/4
MTKGERSWSVRLTSPAEADFQNVIAWTLEQFGDRQAIIYAATLSAALNASTAGPTTVGVKERSDIGKGLFTLHVARSDRKGRHFVLFRAGSDQERLIEVLRLLHDAMDLSSHVPD